MSVEWRISVISEERKEESLTAGTGWGWKQKIGKPNFRTEFFVYPKVDVEGEWINTKND